MRSKEGKRKKGAYKRSKNVISLRPSIRLLTLWGGEGGGFWHTFRTHRIAFLVDIGPTRLCVFHEVWFDIRALVQSAVLIQCAPYRGSVSVSYLFSVRPQRSQVEHGSRARIVDNVPWPPFAVTFGSPFLPFPALVWPWGKEKTPPEKFGIDGTCLGLFCI